MVKRITASELTGLPDKEVGFVIEYVKDFDARRAAEASGYHPDHGYNLIEKVEIQAAVARIQADRLDASNIDAEWLLMEAVDNHKIARQRGKLSASNTALNLIARHVFVDAFAAEKIEVSSDKEVMERLLRARKRRETESPKKPPPSFL